MNCRGCGSSNITVFLSLGSTGLANNLPAADDLSKQDETYPLDVAFCEACKLAQLTTVVLPEKLFSHYLYVTSTTQTFRDHFTNMAHHLTNLFSLSEGALVIDIGSNDGLLLKGFKQHSICVVGVEPAKNIAAIAQKDGVETINAFFGAEIVDSIIQTRGKANLITANNVFAHIADISAVVENVKRLLKPNGVFVIECHYIFSMFDKLTFDAIYHEHLYYYSLTALSTFFRSRGMDVFRVEKVDSHGGSLRVFAQMQGSAHRRDESVTALLEEEKRKGVDALQTYQEFASRVYAVRSRFVDIIKKHKSAGKKIAGYGVPAKATTLLTFCGVGKEVLDYIVDDNPLKQGRFTPVGRIPIVSSTHLAENTPDYIMILAWNFADEIMRKLDVHKAKGVKFIVPFPEPKIIE